MSNFKNIKYIICIIILFGCARPQPPTGGPKDEEPPNLLNSTPSNETLNFKDNTITLEFDEYIKLNNIKNALNVTPKINEDYEYKIKKTKVYLSNLILEDSITYTFNFGEGVTDVTENNPAENLIIIFSTGSFLDSLNINGNVTEILTGQPLEKALLALYDITDTLDIFTGRAKYTVNADEAGNFNFTNLKNGKYRLYTVNDNNKNFKCEPDKESFGFYSNIIDLNQDYDSLKLYTRKRNFKPFKITNLRTTGKYFEIRSSKYISSYQLVATQDSSMEIYSNRVDNNHNIRIYNTLEFTDSIQVHLSAADTINQSIDTLFYLKFQESNRKSPDFNITIKDATLKPDNVFRATVSANKPVYKINTDSIYFKYDSITFIPIDLNQNIIWNNNKTSFSIEKQLDPAMLKKKVDSKQPETDKDKKEIRVPGKGNFKSNQQNNKVTLFIGSSAIISVEQDSSIQITEDFHFTETVNFGKIKCDIISEYTHFIVQLMNASNEVIEEIKNQIKFEFKDLEPGDYNIRILIDDNQNGRWDEGTVEDFTAPEPVFHLNKTIPLRANWEENETITIPKQ